VTRTSTATLRALALAALLGGSGVLHLTRPEPFDAIVPRRLGAPRPWTTGSGIAEIACAVGLVYPRTRSKAGLACAALFVGVFPANVRMALDAWPRRHDRPGYLAVTLARLPLQIPLVTWAIRVAWEGSA